VAIPPIRRRAAFQQHVTETFPPALAARAQALACSMPEEQLEALSELLGLVSEWAIGCAVAVEADRWERMLAHSPGLATALDSCETTLTPGRGVVHSATATAPKRSDLIVPAQSRACWGRAPAAAAGSGERHSWEWGRRSAIPASPGRSSARLLACIAAQANT
jgi:hypothetical protein